MPKMTHIAVRALKDSVNIVTAVKRLRYQKVEGLPNGGMPEGQSEFYDNTHGITLQLDQEIEIDVTDSQLPAFQAAVDRGDIEVMVHAPVQAPTVVQMAPTPVQAPASMEKGKGK